MSDVEITIMTYSLPKKCTALFDLTQYQHDRQTKGQNLISKYHASNSSPMRVTKTFALLLV